METTQTRTASSVKAPAVTTVCNSLLRPLHTSNMSKDENSFDIVTINGNDVETTFDLSKESFDLLFLTRCFVMLLMWMCSYHLVLLGCGHSLTNQDSCPTCRTAARPVPKGVAIFCLFIV